MLSSELEICLNEAFQAAREARHEFMTVEHLLLAIIDTPKVREILRACGADATRLRKELERVHRADDAAAEAGRRPRSAADAGLPARAAARRVPRAVERQEGSPRRQRAGGDIQREALARRVSARAAGVRASTSSITSPTACPRPATSARRDREEPAQGEGEREGEGSSALEKYATNLNQLASEGRIDPLIGRQLEIERTIEILCRRRKNNPLYVGEAGVGKTAMVEGLARLIVEGEVPEVLAGSTVLLARPGLADRRHQVSRRLREAPEGRARGAQEAAGRDPVHRRDPHGHRRRRRLGRRHGRVEPDQARARQRRAALHRLDDLPGIPRHLREGPRAGAALPEDRHRRADGRGDDRDPARAAAEVRGAPRHPLRRRGAAAPRPSSRPATSTTATCPTRPST